MDNEKFVEGLRRVADWYEEHPSFPQPGGYSETKGMFTTWCRDKDGVVEAKEAFGKGAVLEVSDSYFNVYKSFGEMQLNVWATRASVCTKRVIGTKKVKERVATQWTDEMVDQEIVEWDCPEELKETEKENENV